ncbi:heavy metal translocating P-type ATPase [Thalassoroseus pseudoceratinae]|uniref:heavy metal translocating P-type ATPase n=1 Tax=Thalassoroseus pseudoceratinae TaxID=2713176 RepID=UPI0014241E65|nr:heavy metal translocating P-type ATPase [Thalassoroseus pseudoceratinae]
MNSSQELFKFKVHGLCCAEEVALLKREVGRVVGNEDRIGFDILNGTMSVQPGAVEASADDITEAVSRTGMRAEVLRQDEPVTSSKRFWDGPGRNFLTVISGLFGLAGFLTHVWLSGGAQAAFGSEGMGMTHHVPPASKVLYAVGIAAGIWLVLPKAWFALRRVRPDMNLLMVVAVSGAVAINEWFEAAVVVFLFSASLALESWSVGRARRAIAALMDLAPPTACIRRDDGTEVHVPPEEVSVGTLFIVRPGEKLPLDGYVVHGSSNVNQSPITGESIPVVKQPGDTVFAGTVNGDGALEIECTKPAQDTTLAHIIRMVGEAQSRRAPAEQWVEKFARIYTPIVMGLAATVLIAGPLLFDGVWSEWLYRSLVLLVIACPCALVISTPVSIVASLAAAARNGVLIKGGVYVEAPARLDAIALDKTGTLTEGTPTVGGVVPLDDHTETELLERASALEARSDHPLARAIVDYARDREVTIQPVEDFQIVPGKGAVGRLNNKRYWLGSHRYLQEQGQETAEVCEQLEALSKSGQSVVVIGNDEHVCGFISLADTVRPAANDTLQALRETGIRHLVMLTGDNQQTAEAVAQELHLDEVHAELLPEGKVHVVETLVGKFGGVAMVGDGVNDAPALARASIGIAMGAAGSDAAIETADIALMSDDLAKLPWLIRHSRRTLRIIRQNIGFSLAVKVIFVLLTFSGYTSLWAAIAADAGTSLLVIFNGLRLLKIN